MAAPGEEKIAAGQSIFSRKIEFHLARRPYTGVPPSSGGFHLEILNPGISDGPRSASESCAWASAAEAAVNGKRSPGGEFHEHGLDPELSLRITFQRIGAGLENLGNTCYLNSVLQCLTYTEPFAAYLQSGKHKSTCRAAGFCAMCALQNHVKDALQSTGKILRPFHLVKNLRCISRSFRNSRQEDAHEYMVNLLESMHKCCLPSGVPSESPSAYEKSLVHKIFGGQLRSQVKCMQCSNCSDKFDPFLDLSLEIARADSLRKAFAHFTATEQLDGGERQYQCQHCKKKVQAFKQLTIHKAPCVLTIHLKRFGSSIHGEKINKKIEFESSLDLKPFVSGLHEGELKYTLYGVLVHAGWSTHSGHYFCYVRTSTGMWYSLDDNHVSQVSEKIVLSREAYMLFYVKDKTSAIKRSTTYANLKSDISANSTLNKEITSVGRKLNNAIYSSAKAIHDAIIQSPPIFKNKNPLDHSKTKGGDYMLPNGLCKTKACLSFDTKKEVADMSAPGAAGQQSMACDVKRPMNPSNAMNSGCTFEECNSTNLLEHQKNSDGFLSATSCSAEEVILAVPEIENSPGDNCRKGAMSKKSKIPLAAQGVYFGRRQLLFMSLRVHRKKKKKPEKWARNSQNKMNRRLADLRTDSDEAASTSESFQSVDLDSMRFEKEMKGRKGEKSQINDNEVYRRSCTDGEKQEILKHAEDNDLQSCNASLLKSRLREPTVAKWDNENLVIPQINELEHPPKRNIGYILDEWDEEYDKGKRRKLKSRQWFDGPNPFQKTADLKVKTHQRLMKAAHSKFGKEPLRI